MAHKHDRNAYVESFLNQYNLIMLGFSVVLGMIFFSWLPLLIAFGLEIMYLALFPDTALYEAYIKRKYAELDAAEERKLLETRLASLTSAQRANFDMIQTLVVSTKENFREKQAESMYSSMITKLDQLQVHFLRMMELINSYESYLNSVRPGELERARNDVRRQLQTSSARLQKSLHERLDILDKRIDRLKSVRENHTIVRTQLDTIADMMRFFYESSLTMDNPKGISQKIDDLLIDLESTEETVLEFDDTSRAMSTFDEALEEAVHEAQVHR
ncbi:MAG: hypothetical protein AAGI01_11790 [Myxococcota bacterium]